jgi:hypothetical protein
VVAFCTWEAWWGFGVPNFVALRSCGGAGGGGGGRGRGRGSQSKFWLRSGVVVKVHASKFT